MHYTATPTDLPTLATLNESIDRAQQLLDATLTDLEQHPSSSIEFRLRAIKDIIDCAYRLTAIRKTLIALRARPKENAQQLRAITGMVSALHQQMMAIRATTTPTPTPGTPPSPTAASTPDTPSCAPSAPGCDLSSRAPREPLPCDLISPEGATQVSPVQAQRRPGLPVGAQRPLDSPSGEPRESHIPKRRPRKPRYSIKNPPTLNQLIPEAMLPTPKPSPSQTATILHHHATQQTETAGILPASSPTQLAISSPSVSERLAARHALNSSRTTNRIDRLTHAIGAHIPYSVYTAPENLAYTLPPRSPKATTYAPLLDLDLIPFVKSVPTLPITNYLTPDFSHTNTPTIPPDLTTQIENHLATITNKTTNLRADLLLPPPPKPTQTKKHLETLYTKIPIPKQIFKTPETRPPAPEVRSP